MSWDKFLASMEILKKVYHIILVAVPGHDLTINEEFTSVEQISKCIENMQHAQYVLTQPEKFAADLKHLLS